MMFMTSITVSSDYRSKILRKENKEHLDSYLRCSTEFFEQFFSGSRIIEVCLNFLGRLVVDNSHNYLIIWFN